MLSAADKCESRACDVRRWWRSVAGWWSHWPLQEARTPAWVTAPPVGDAASLAASRAACALALVTAIRGDENLAQTTVAALPLLLRHGREAAAAQARSAT